MPYRTLWAAALLLVTAMPSRAADIDSLLTRVLEDMPENPEVQMLTVSYAPGEASEPHRHNSHVFVYVLEGRVRMQVEGGRPVTLSPGDTFHERPEDVHVLSENASDTGPATFLVFFVKEAGAPPTVPVRTGASSSPD